MLSIFRGSQHLLVLPLTWFGIAVLVWLVALTPGLIEIHRQFQHESAPY